MSSEQSQPSTKILITGGSGFISLETVKQALEAGHQVRTTIRSESKKQSLIDVLQSKSVDVTKLSFIEADLLKDDNWSEACKDIEIVLHIASPFPLQSPKHEDELILPARDGTLRVLKAAKEQKVKKVVITSSVAAVCYGTEWRDKIYTEQDWSNHDTLDASAYMKSKCLAEKAAWKFYEDQEEGDYKMEMATINPAAVFGPPLKVPSESTTVGIILQMLQGKMPIVPDISFGVVDVRDVAALHLIAAFSPSANGQRYLCSTRTLSLAEIGKILQTLPDGKGSKAPIRTIPNFLVKVLSYVSSQLKVASPSLGQRRILSSEKAKALGWDPRSDEEAILSCAKALIDAEAVPVSCIVYNWKTNGNFKHNYRSSYRKTRIGPWKFKGRDGMGSNLTGR